MTNPTRDPDELAALASGTHATAGALSALADRMETAGWRTDEYSVPDLRAVANSLHGMSIRVALTSGDAEVLQAVTGRPWKEITFPMVDLDPQGNAPRRTNS